MSEAQALTGSIASSHVIKWLRAWYSDGMPDAIDLEIVRQMLPSTPYGAGVREIKPPVEIIGDAFEGVLARDPDDHAVWGIAYNGKVRRERQRFTIAHELGHFILHRSQKQRFNCDSQSVHTGIDGLRQIEREAEGDTRADVSVNAPEDVISFGMRMHLSISAEDYVRTENDLKELVLLRNNLVHHFIDQHDLWSQDGCRGAHDALLVAYSRIDQHFEQLRGWAEHMDQARQLAAEFVQSDVFHDLVVNGIAPDGTVDWPASGIVRALREAAGDLAVEGWAPVAVAGRWIVERHPEQLPAKYGCSSWRQVVHESRLFDLRYREVDGQRAAWYRDKAA